MTQIRDLIVVIPGITGSVLEKDGREVWAVSGQAFWQGLTSGLDSISNLALTGVDDPHGNDPQYDDDLGDGIRATRLIDTTHIVPGFHKIDGYSELRRLLTQNFEVIKGDINSDQPANYFEFPYDWRRDNRVSARRLERFIEEKLARWHHFGGSSDAKTILIAHSMGGLISRYYLEVLGGWQKCKLLVTFGTAYRGSLNMIDNLAYGVKFKKFGTKIPLDLLTQVMKTLPSTYQLLPRYPVVKVKDKWLRITETDVIPNLTPDIAKKALSFIKEIDKAREENEKESRYRGHRYKIIPVVGTHQQTWQSAFVENNKLLMSYTPPPNVGDALATGDGTVPRVSAVPLELSLDFRESFLPEKHASLQSNASLLSRLAESLETTQSNIDFVMGGEPIPELHKEILTLIVDDIYPANLPLIMKVGLLNAHRVKSELVLKIKGAGGIKTIPVSVNEDTLEEIELPSLPPGIYSVELSTSGGKAPPVHDVFAVAM